MNTQSALQVTNCENIPLVNLENPFPMQYLGSKARIARWIVGEIYNKFPQSIRFVDLFAGTGIVSLSARNLGYRLYINDIQPYAFIVLKSIFCEQRDGIDDILSGIIRLKEDSYLLASGRYCAEKQLREERDFFQSLKSNSWSWEKYNNFCEATDLISGNPSEVEKLKKENKWNLFTKYYFNTYFGVEQCLQIDALREYAESLTSESDKTHVIAATITALTYAVSSTTHLAQYLKPTSKTRSKRLVKRRSISIIDEVVTRLKKISSFPLQEQQAEVFQKDFRNTLAMLPLDKRTVVYVDPPYFKEHYSRYYHILDTFYLYDYPTLTYNDRLGQTTVGRYRSNRIVSDFGLKGSVKKAFADLFDQIKTCGAKVALSYANTSLVSKEDLLLLAKSKGLTVDIKQIKLMHSGQGQPRNKIVTEFLFLLES